MRQPIQIYEYAETRTATNGSRETYTLYGTDYADITDITSGKEVSGVVGQMDSKVFKIDYRPSLNITDKWQIEFEGVRYTIQAINKSKNENFKLLIKAKAKH